jgi:sulfite reductase beta subunit-like hemoprotein
VNGHFIPAYQLHLGGKIGAGEARVGDPLDKIPAKHVPKAVAALLRLYKEARLEEEPFPTSCSAGRARGSRRSSRRS